MKKVLKKWGWYKVLAKGNGFKVKLLYLKPFGKTSLQRHKHRSEIWIFLDSQEVNPVRELCSLTVCAGPIRNKFSNWADGGFKPPSPLSGNNRRLKSAAFSNGVKIAERHQWHHLNNPSNKGLRLIEVQIGICQERDIERQRK